MTTYRLYLVRNGVEFSVNIQTETDPNFHGVGEVIAEGLGSKFLYAVEA